MTTLQDESSIHSCQSIQYFGSHLSAAIQKNVSRPLIILQAKLIKDRGFRLHLNNVLIFLYVGN